MSNKHWHGDIEDEENSDESEEDEESEEVSDNDIVEQVCDMLCPHCHRPIRLALAPADDEPGDDEDDFEEDEDVDDEDE